MGVINRYLMALLLAIVVALPVQAGPVLATPPLQASIDSCYTVADDAGRLVEFQLGPTPAVIGDTLMLRGGNPVSELIESLAFAPDGSVLYSAIQNDDGGALDGLGDSVFITIDPATGVVTDVGASLTLGTADDEFEGSLGSIASGQVTGLAVQQTLAGPVLWAVSKYAGPGGDASALFQINPATGQHVSNAFGAGVDYLVIFGTLSPCCDEVQDLAISLDGVFLIETHSRLYELDPATGGATLIAPFSPASNQMEGLTFTADGTLYATQGESGGFDNQLDIVDPVTAVRTQVLPLPLFGSPPEGDYESVACSVVFLPGPVPGSGSDLSVVKTAAEDHYTAGGQINYTIVVSNAGPEQATGALVEDSKPPKVNDWQWTCALESGGASGCTPTAGFVTTDFSDTLDLPPGGSVTYNVTANVAVDSTLTISNTASVTPPAGVVDEVLENNQSTVNTPAHMYVIYFPQVYNEPPIEFYPLTQPNLGSD